ncbi:MAG: DNA-binding response regulator [Sphingobacteriales bacterium]|nr:MAG: DNA-binding response regulator [Sphingobacteriales bacterium]TAF82723.1 MAG: DNA-binding response regulator [Sphingobacteriales bacterium]
MNKNIKIAIVEDDENLRFLVVHRLINEGFTVIQTGNGQLAEELIITEQPNIVLLDWMLPHKDGAQICTSLRAKGFENQIIMMTAKAQDLDKIDAYNFGVSDYITKPFNMDVMVAMLENKIKYLQPDKIEINKFGTMEYHPNTLSVVKNDIKIELTILENRILTYFLQNANKIVSREDLMMEVWGYDADLSTRTLDMHIVRLRKKLETNPDNPEYLQTVRGLGYRLTF